MEENNITLQDVNLILNIITVCSKRGAFEPKEFSVVGGLTNKLIAILDANKPAEAPVEQMPEAPTDEQLELDLK